MAKTQKLEAVLSLRDRFSTALDKAKKNTKNYGKEWERQARKIKRNAKEIEKAGRSLSKGLTAPILASAGASVAAFKTVDEGYQNMISKTGATGEAAKDLEKTYKRVYKSLYFDATSVGDATGEMQTQFGLLGDSLENATIYALKFAHINKADVSKSIIGASKVARQFNVDNKDISLIFDAVTKSAQNTGVSVDKIFDAVADGAPALQALGLNVAESAELLARAEQAGLDSTTMLGKLSKASIVYAKKGKTLSEGLQETIGSIKGAKSEVEAYAIASEVFGARGADVMAKAIRDGRLDAELFSGTLNSVRGVVANTEKEMRSPFEEFEKAIKPAKEGLASFGGTILETTIPLLSTLSVWINKGAKAFSELSPETKKMIVYMGLFAASAGPTLIVVGRMISTFATLRENFNTIKTAVSAVGTFIGGLSAPVLIAVGAITALIGVGYLLYKNWDKVKAVGGAVWTFIKDHITSNIELIKAVFDGFVTFIDGIVHGDWKKAIEGLKRIAMAPLKWLENRFNALKKLWETLKGIFSSKGKGGVVPDKSKGSKSTPPPSPIPSHSRGTNYFRGGLTFAHERMKGEIISPPRGSKIYPHDKSIQMAYQDGQNSVVRESGAVTVSFSGAIFQVREEADINKVANSVVKKLVEYKANRVPKGVMG